MDFETVSERLDCAHRANCDYHNVYTEISGSYVENKLTLEKKCRNCNGRNHLMFDIDDYSTTIEQASVGDKFDVNERVRIARCTEGDTLTVTAIAENPRAIDSPVYSGDKVLVSLTRNLDSDSKYRVDTVSPDRLQKLIDNEKIQKR